MWSYASCYAMHHLIWCIMQCDLMYYSNWCIIPCDASHSVCNEWVTFHVRRLQLTEQNTPFARPGLEVERKYTCDEAMFCEMYFLISHILINYSHYVNNMIYSHLCPPSQQLTLTDFVLLDTAVLLLPIWGAELSWHGNEHLIWIDKLYLTSVYQEVTAACVDFVLGGSILNLEWNFSYEVSCLGARSQRDMPDKMGRTTDLIKDLLREIGPRYCCEF